ncbi:hypothetical protein Hanom_Chr06g00502171 [Helianthus anomalus]
MVFPPLSPSQSTYTHSVHHIFFYHLTTHFHTYTISAPIIFVSCFILPPLFPFYFKD